MKLQVDEPDGWALERADFEGCPCTAHRGCVTVAAPRRPSCTGRRPELIDRLIWKGACALGLTNAGGVEVGQRADQWRYDQSAVVRERPPATAAAMFLDLVAHTRPAAALVDGEWTVGTQHAVARGHCRPSAGDFAMRFAH